MEEYGRSLESHLLVLNVQIVGSQVFTQEWISILTGLNQILETLQVAELILVEYLVNIVIKIKDCHIR